MNKFFKELRRRNVVRVAGVYAVAGWVLVQIATTLEESMNLPAWFDGLVVALLIIGLPVALIVAWAFELTPDGVVRTEDVPEDQSVTAETGRQLDYAIIAGIVILAIVIVMTRSDQGTTEEDAIAGAAPQQSADVSPDAPQNSYLEKSIAVLPFENRSPNADDAFFAAGVHDDLLTHLSKVADMHVISRTSVMGFAGSNRKIPDIGRELGVATVMEGAVQRAGNRVRINVQLIDVATDNHIWAEIYDRDLTADNIFDIQSEITKAIANALNSVLSDSDEAELAERPTQNLAAYDAFVEGKLQTVIYERGAPPMLAAIENFNEAIANDPQFGEAYALRAYAEIALHWYTAEPGDWVAAANESLRIAARFAPDAIETHMARGYYHYWGHLDYVAADAEFELALEKSPNYVLAIGGKAFAARRAGRFEEAITLLEMGSRLDPLNLDMHGSLIQTLTALGRYDDSDAALARATAANVNFDLDPTVVSHTWLDRGDTLQAWRAVETIKVDHAEIFYLTRLDTALMTRDPERIRSALEAWPENLRSPGHAPEVYNISRAEVMLALGETEAARALFEEIKARIDSSDNPYPEGWQANAMYYPVELPGYVGDLDGVRSVIAEAEDSRRPDAWAEIDYLWVYAQALLRAGAPDEALDYVDRMVEIRGPYIYLRLSIDPAFDSLREHPRYLALKAAYEAWAAD
jgi:TolB-like protein/Tfp pilus assembly protein PilF